MCLPVPEVDRFYALWKPLLLFVNRQYKLVPSLLNDKMGSTLGGQDARKIREKLWENDTLLDVYIAENPAHHSDQDLALVASWKHHFAGTFFVFKYLKKHAIFIGDGERRVYAVKGLYSPLEEIFGTYLPILTDAILLPWENEIITDGLFQFYNIRFGSGIHSDLKTVYDDAKELGDIVTSLLPSGSVAPYKDQLARAEAANAKVLKAFQKYLYQSGQSTKIVERDMATIKALSAKNLGCIDGPSSLREIDWEILTQFLSALQESEKRQATTGVKRFVKFLLETDRIDIDAAEDMLLTLKGGE